MDPNSTVAAVLHGALDIHIEQRQSQQLLPGQARVQMMATGLCGSDRQFFSLSDSSISTHLFFSPLLSTWTKRRICRQITALLGP